MEDFDVFTDEIEFSRPVYKNLLNKYVTEIPRTPSGPNYESSRKLIAEEFLSEGNEKACAFYLSETASSSVRTLAVYRDEQMQNAKNKMQKIISYIKPIQEIVNSTVSSKQDEEILKCLSDTEDTKRILDQYEVEDVPFYKQYMKFSTQNNVENFVKIIKELPKEWTVVQLTTRFNPNENLKPQTEYRTEIDAIYITLLTNDYSTQYGPLTVCAPANITKDGEMPLFAELYSILHENFKTIEDAHFSNKKLVKKYWERREDIDLRMKSVLNVMSRDWLGGWCSLLTGKLVDEALRNKLVKLVDCTIDDWGFIKLTAKQKILLYNLIESCIEIDIIQIKSCIRTILTEHGNIDEVRTVLKGFECEACAEDFQFLNDLCLNCLTKSFQLIHHFSLADGIKAFSELATQVKDDWSDLKNAERYPVILIVDEIIDPFPWETLSVLYNQPVSRIENIHFLYFLFKKHEKQIVNGYFCAQSDIGRYVINPEKNLEYMENRMKSFLKYWCQSWTGHIGEAPTPEDFFNYITKSDIFLYCGHGDGWQMANGNTSTNIADGRCSALLSGCGSVRLARAPGRAPPAAAHHHLHVAACPVVVGMLWEVTDLEVDKVISRLLSLYVPTDAPVDWTSVGKEKWSMGQIDLSKSQKCPPAPECDLLKAICRARSATNFTMIASSLVARGLPVRVAQD
ncbi:separin [Aricia agestis]|uniref:separin n=1 Tax=Aricia agestis TaxID=91739 RepID=UPI001C205EC6|nr:separin [Aricia agestis]